MAEVNAVGSRERAKAAMHEAKHVAAAMLVGVVPVEVRILPPSRERGGYCQGTCDCPPGTGRGVLGVVSAVGILDGFGAAEDEIALLEDFPAEDDREQVMQAAAQAMAHREFNLIANRIARRLRFVDVIRGPELARIAADVTGATVDGRMT